MKKYIKYISEPSTIIILCAMSLLGSASIGLAQDSPWSTVAPMNTPKYGHGQCTVNGKIYVFGGTEVFNNGCGDAGSKTVEEYNPETNSWSLKKPMPTPRGAPASVVNDTIYVIGGGLIVCQGGLKLVEAYDPHTDSWSTKDSMNVGRWGLSTSVVNGKIYAIGGINYNTGNYISAVEEFDPDSNSWSFKEPMPTERAYFNTCVVDEKIYAFGGAKSVNNSNTTLDIIEVYDPGTNTWETKKPMPFVLQNFSVTSLNGLIYIFGGTSSPAGEPVSNAWEYNPQTEEWKSLSKTPIWRRNTQSSEIDGKIYITGGSITDWPLHPINEVEVYNPQNDLFPLFENLYVDKSFAMAGVDSVLITSEINNPTGITLNAKIEAGEATVYSVELFDDGDHNDGNAEDGLFANSWMAQSGIEGNFSIKLQVTRIDSDTVVNHLDTDVVFTTIGPVQLTEPAYLDTSYLESTNTQFILLILQNSGKITSAENLSIELKTEDPRVERMEIGTRTFPDLEAGVIDTSTIFNYFAFEYAENMIPDCTLTKPIPFDVIISSDEYPFWHSSFDFVAKNLFPTAITDKFDHLPKEFALNQNYPNPFNPTTAISYQLAKTSEVELSIFNLLGQKVVTLVSKKQTAGSYKVEWDASVFSSGVYLYRLETGDGFIQTQKLVLLK
ncbi:MAG: T9SS C-terminal target domain-containing protein [Calditrichaeota bacterium]|nr:MAG: T9SS C-terminal target domain-containing protein [Calditrichota bacterium]MBL1206800.1 T9SS C-terminal target domain-containing protein [Calditrichota bacterium]NOG46628.1 T9SS type A sorting domain-containing protein [Calditrichota bacterium]